MQVHIQRGTEQFGPYSLEEVQAYVASGQFLPDDLAWHEGLADWVPLSTLLGAGIARPKVTPAIARKKRKLKLVLAPAAVVAVLLLGAAGYVMMTWGRAKRTTEVEIAAKLKAIRDAGEPTTGEELNRWYETPPAGENAADLWLPAFEAMQVTDKDRANPNLPMVGKGSLPEGSAPLAPAMKQAMKEVVERNRAALDKLQKAASRPDCRYPVDFREGFRVNLSHLATLKPAGNLAVLAALQQAEPRTAPLAAQYLSTCLAIGRSLEREPEIMSQLVRMGLLTGAGLGLEVVLDHVALPSEQLTKLQKEFEEADRSDCVTRAFIGKRCLCIDLLQRPPEDLAKEMARDSGGTNTGLGLRIIQVSRARGNRDLFWVLEHYAKLVEISRQTLPERLDAKYDEGALHQKAKQEGALLAGAYMGADLGLATSKEPRCSAYLRMSATTLAVERFRSVNDGKLPATLAELSPRFLPQPLLDPYDGQPLRYKKLDRGYVVYSVGPNRTDDGGKPPAKKGGNEGDLVFAVHR
jgi:hypothetical protein